jgi:hypothetical protein
MRPVDPLEQDYTSPGIRLQRKNGPAVPGRFEIA